MGGGGGDLASASGRKFPGSRQSFLGMLHRGTASRSREGGCHSSPAGSLVISILHLICFRNNVLECFSYQ